MTPPPSPQTDDLFDALICPVTRSPLRLEGHELVSAVCELRYPVRDGIPVLLPSAAALPDGVTSLEQLEQDSGN